MDHCIRVMAEAFGDKIKYNYLSIEDLWPLDGCFQSSGRTFHFQCQQMFGLDVTGGRCKVGVIVGVLKALPYGKYLVNVSDLYWLSMDKSASGYELFNIHPN